MTLELTLVTRNHQLFENLEEEGFSRGKSQYKGPVVERAWNYWESRVSEALRGGEGMR